MLGATAKKLAVQIYSMDAPVKQQPWLLDTSLQLFLHPSFLLALKLYDQAIELLKERIWYMYYSLICLYFEF